MSTIIMRNKVARLFRPKPVLSFFPLCVRTFEIDWPEIVNNANVLCFEKAAPFIGNKFVWHSKCELILIQLATDI